MKDKEGYKALFEYATIGIVVVSQDGVIRQVNPNARGMFGFESNELVGKPLEILLPNRFLKGHSKMRDGYFEKPVARPMGNGGELWAKRKDGSEFPAEISLGSFVLEGERLAVAFITDISERKILDEKQKNQAHELEEKVHERTHELAQTLEREKEINELKTRFVSMASHEFRTPLSAILTSVSLIGKYTLSEQQDKRDKHINRIKSSVNNLTSILNDFLSLDKLEQGKVEIEKTSFNLFDFCQGLVSEMENITKAGQAVKIDMSNEINILAQDKRILRNVLINLISNAIKYSPEDSSIDLRASTEKGKVVIEVEDYGMGIPKDEQKHMFTRFFRAKNAINIEGTGLGLNIVKRYIELMNASISFKSQTEVGTKFTIEFKNL